MSPRWARITKIVNASIVRSSVNATPLPPNPRTYSRPYKTFQSTSILLFRRAFLKRWPCGTPRSCQRYGAWRFRRTWPFWYFRCRFFCYSPAFVRWSLLGGFPGAAEIKHERRPRYDEAEHTDREGHQVSHQDADGGGNRRNPPDG